jgi:uncharacterized protein (TIGR02145 family)
MKTAKLFLFPLCWAKSRRDETLLTVCFSLRTFSLRQILLPALLFFFCANLSAQVTMGGLEVPKKGAILDLNSTTKGGLLLSNVVLENLYTIPTTFPGMSSPPGDVNEKFTGALVYHEGGNGIPAGVYLWNGTNWTPLSENCIAPAWTLNVPPFVKKDAPVTFSVSSDASARCAEGETYAWFKNDVNMDSYTNSAFGSAANVTTSFDTEGDYKVKVSATTPYSPAIIEEEKDITVTADGGPDPSMLTYTYGIVGETCLDVKKSNQGKSDEVFNARKYAFEGGFTKEYKFVHGNSYSELSLSYIDDPTENIIAGITTHPDAAADDAGEETIIVTFKSNVEDLVPANGDSLTVKLYASYKPYNSNEIKYAWLEIRVEDGTCICPARVSETQWLNFMCHNLGGLDIISSSQLITREHHGDWYRFGASQVSMKNIPDNDTRSDSTWDDATFQAGNNNWTNDPCPVGWQLPAITELAAVVNKNIGNTDIIPAINLLTNVPATTWNNSDAELFSHLKKLGDYLYLPAAGWRIHSDGSLDSRGTIGYYWSSTGMDSYRSRNVTVDSGSSSMSSLSLRSNGFSVRCVQAE